eukprot:3991019-Pleurochrysis_carterae.AAC.5
MMVLLGPAAVVRTARATSGISALGWAHIKPAQLRTTSQLQYPLQRLILPHVAHSRSLRSSLLRMAEEESKCASSEASLPSEVQASSGAPDFGDLPTVDENGQPLSKSALKKLKKAAQIAAKKAQKAAADPGTEKSSTGGGQDNDGMPEPPASYSFIDAGITMSTKDCPDQKYDVVRLLGSESGPAIGSETVPIAQKQLADDERVELVFLFASHCGGETASIAQKQLADDERVELVGTDPRSYGKQQDAKRQFSFFGLALGGTLHRAGACSCAAAIPWLLFCRADDCRWNLALLSPSHACVFQAVFFKDKETPKQSKVRLLWDLKAAETCMMVFQASFAVSFCLFSTCRDQQYC